MELVEMGQTGWTDNNRSVHLLCLYLFEYQDAFQMNTNIRIIRIIRIMNIRMRTLIHTDGHNTYRRTWAVYRVASQLITTNTRWLTLSPRLTWHRMPRMKLSKVLIRISIIRIIRIIRIFVFIWKASWYSNKYKQSKLSQKQWWLQTFQVSEIILRNACIMIQVSASSDQNAESIISKMSVKMIHVTKRMFKKTSKTLQVQEQIQILSKRFMCFQP